MIARRRKLPRAMALISLLMVSVLCMMMLAAFLQSNRTYLQLFNRGVAQDQMADANRSLADFVRCHLEQDKYWGRPFGTESGWRRWNGDIGWREHRVPSRPEYGVITGELPNSLVFRLDVVNNMRSPAERAGVQPRCAGVTITVYQNPSNIDLVAGQPRALLETPDRFVFAGGARLLLRNAALYDSGVVASTGIALHANKLSFLSKDPIRNQIRSNAGILMPEATVSPERNYDFGFLEETSRGNWERYAPRGFDGTVWARNDIVFGTDTAPDDEKIQRATEITNANFISNAQTQHSIPELQPSDIKVGADDPKQLTAGVYRFVERRVTYHAAGLVNPPPEAWRIETIKVLEQSIDEEGGVPDKFHYIKGHLPPGIDYGTVRIVNTETHAPTEVPSQAHESLTNEDCFNLLDIDGDPSGLVVDLSEQVMVVKPDAVVDVPGDFVVTSLGAEESTRPVQLVLGDGAGGLGTVRAQGNIKVEGYVWGKGSLISSQDVLMRPNNVDVEASTQSDLAIYAKRNVIVLDETNAHDSHQVSLRGLIYAGENFYFRSDTNLSVEGSLVARNGHVFLIAGTAERVQTGPEEFSLRNINGSHNLNVIYNPDYLDSLLNTDVQERTKVELLAWRPGL